MNLKELNFLKAIKGVENVNIKVENGFLLMNYSNINIKKPVKRVNNLCFSLNLKTTKKIKDDYTTIKKEEEDIIFINPKMDIRLRSEKFQDFNFNELEIFDYELELNSYELYENINKIDYGMLKDSNPLSANLSGIFLDIIDTQKINLCASDSYQLAISNIKTNVKINKNDTSGIMIGYKQIEFIKNILKNNKDKKVKIKIKKDIEQKTDIIQLHINELIISILLKQINYPAYQEIISNTTTRVKIDIPKKEMKEINNKAKQLFTQAFFIIKKENNNFKFYIDSNFKNRIDPKFNVEIVEDNLKKMDIDNIKVAFGVDKIQKILSNLSDENFTMEITGTINPCFIKEGNITHVLMPTRHNN